MQHPPLHPGSGGMRVEANVGVTKDDVDVLTAYPRELRSLGPGADVHLKGIHKTTKTGTSPIISQITMGRPLLRPLLLLAGCFHYGWRRDLVAQTS